MSAYDTIIVRAIKNNLDKLSPDKIEKLQEFHGLSHIYDDNNRDELLLEIAKKNYEWFVGTAPTMHATRRARMNGDDGADGDPPYFAPAAPKLPEWATLERTDTMPLPPQQSPPSPVAKRAKLSDEPFVYFSPKHQQHNNIHQIPDDWYSEGDTLPLGDVDDGDDGNYSEADTQPMPPDDDHLLSDGDDSEYVEGDTQPLGDGDDDH